MGSSAFETNKTYKRKIGEKIIGYKVVQNCHNIEHIEKIEVAKFLLKGKSKIAGKIVSNISDKNEKTFVHQSQQK